MQDPYAAVAMINALREPQAPPQAPLTQLAGSVTPLPINPLPTAQPTPNAAPYAWGQIQSPNIKPIFPDEQRMQDAIIRLLNAGKKK